MKPINSRIGNMSPIFGNSALLKMTGRALREWSVHRASECGVADGARTHDNRNHNPSPLASNGAALRPVRGNDCLGFKHRSARLSRGLFPAFAIVLAACGGGGDADACTPIVARVQLFGDSTQAGFDGGTNALAPHRPAVELQARLDAEFGPGATLVIDEAVNGSTAQELVAGADNHHQPWPRSVAAQIVVVNSGINDMVRYGGPRFGEYAVALDALSKVPPGVTLIFETPNIVKGWEVSHYAQAMREAANRNRWPVADVYAYTSRLPDWQALIPDWAHPSDPLYVRIVDDVLAPAVAEQVRQLRCLPSSPTRRNFAASLESLKP